MQSEVMQILRFVDAQFEPIARGEIDHPNETEQEDAPIDNQDAAEDDNDESAFMFAYESTGCGDEDSIMGDIDGTVITEPTPSKDFPASVSMNSAGPPHAKDVTMSDSSENEN